MAKSKPTRPTRAVARERSSPRAAANPLPLSSSAASEPSASSGVEDAADLAAAKVTLGALPEPALLTGEKWSGGGVEIIFVNARFTELTGFTAAELVGRNTRVLHGPRTEVLAPTADTDANAKRLLAGESWLYRKDGSAFFGRWRFAPLLPGVQVAVYHDLSEVERLQAALLHSQQLDTVGQLTSGIAHDFNNLLSIINGYAEILGAKLAQAPEPVRKDLAEIQRAGVKAASIARQILEFSRRQDHETRVVNPNLLIREIADMLRRAMGEAVQVELRLASDLGNTRIDPTRFQQVLLNLCFNARDAMPGGGKLTVRTSNHREPDSGARRRAGNYVRIEVTDTGTGFDAATRARIFEPFFTTKPHGTGLGLSTVLAIVQQVDGSLEVRSQPGAGTTFEIFLPETAEAADLPAPAASTRSTRGTETVWLIETDEVVRKMVSGILAVDGYRVHEFTHVRDALARAAESEAPDVVLLDSAAPDASPLVHRLAGLNPRLKVLAVSVASPAVFAELPLLALGHLPKPFALSTLLRVVRDLLDRTR